jgi:DNA adenine methylase
MNGNLKAPFPYFGGKSKIASLVWFHLGNPKRYIEPFFGSGAVLLNRPETNIKDEIVNDKDGFISNVWRSIQFSPQETSKWCDWPVNHADLCARRKTLIKNEDRLLENLINDDMWHDPKIAGYWIWAASCWIGSGLTRIGAIPKLTSNDGINSGQIPMLDHNNGITVANSDRIQSWIKSLAERLRFVKVVCGDWTRVCGGNWQDSGGSVGIFFDPPYSDKADRYSSIYNSDSLDIAHDVRKWCIERGKLATHRIILAGYEGEHEELAQHGWVSKNWTANGGYANQGKNKGQNNRHKEILWISPHCVNIGNELELLKSN